MPEQSKTVSIARPVSAVFAFLADAENDKRWRHGVLEMTRTGGEGVGTTYRQVLKGPNGRRIDADIQTTELVADRRIAFRTVTGPIRTAGSYDLQPIDNGTEVTFRLIAKLVGVKKLMTPLVIMAMKSEVDALSELKRVLETSTQT